MFGFIPVSQQLRRVEKENIILKDNIEKAQADVAYVAMMTDVDIFDEEVEEDE